MSEDTSSQVHRPLWPALLLLLIVTLVLQLPVAAGTGCAHLPLRLCLVTPLNLEVRLMGPRLPRESVSSSAGVGTLPAAACMRVVQIRQLRFAALQVCGSAGEDECKGLPLCQWCGPKGSRREAMCWAASQCFQQTTEDLQDTSS